MKNKIQFFDDRGKSLGTFDICPDPSHDDCIECARNNNINFFNKCIVNEKTIFERRTDFYIVDKNNKSYDLEIWRTINRTF
jgi:hypothetical protein